VKPVKSFHGSIEGDLAPEKVIEMDLDLSPEGRAHLLTLMTDLYSDQELAVVREYSTNARDAMIMAGKGHLPIRVYLPTALSPHLTITDEGVGLSINDLETIFSKYGASNKRGSDAVNGMLGLGGKSALTYTSQFMVTSCHDGVKAQIIVTRNEDGIGIMEVVDTRATTEGNGVEIKIPVKGSHNFVEKVAKFFYYWQPGSVLVDGKAPNSIHTEKQHTKIGDDVFIVKKNYYDEKDDIIVMGGVPYTLTGDNSDAFSSIVTPTDRHGRYGYNQSQVIVFVEMGDITFAPSRESASFTPRTMATIDRIKGEIKANLTAQIEADLTNAASYSEAFTLWAKWTDLVGIKNIPDVEYKGSKFSVATDAVYSTLNIGGGRYNYRTGDNADSVSNSEGNTKAVGLSDIYKDRNLCVVGYDNLSAPAGNSRLKVKQYIEDELNGDIDTVFFFDTMPGSPWTDEVRRVEWSVIKDIVISQANRTYSGKTGKIPVTIYTGGIDTSPWRNYTQIGKWEDKPVDSTKPIYYVSPGDLKESGSHNLRRAVDNVFSFFPEAQIVLLGRNRWDKFVKENPTAKELLKYYRNDFDKDMVKGMSEDEIFWADHDDSYRKVAQWVGDSTDDADLTRLSKIAKGIDSAKVAVYNGVKAPTKALHNVYVLGVDSYYHRENKTYKAHAIAYINAVIKEGNN
jgi:hypothetical protein